MKEKIEKIKDTISSCGELLNNNINKDYAFTYGEIYDTLMGVLKEMQSGTSEDINNEVIMNTTINAFFDKAIDKFYNYTDYKNITFAEQDAKDINEMLFECFNNMDEIIKWVEEQENIKKMDSEQ